MKNLFILFVLFTFHFQCFAQKRSTNYLDSLNYNREKPLWFVHFPDSSIVSTYNLIFLRENVIHETVQKLVEQWKLHPKAFGVVCTTKLTLVSNV
jgi:hypothetical protein